MAKDRGNAFSEEWLWEHEEVWMTPGVAKFIIQLAVRNGVTYSMPMEKALAEAANLPPRKLGDPPRVPRNYPPGPKPKPPPPELDGRSRAAGEGNE